MELKWVQITRHLFHVHAAGGARLGTVRRIMRGPETVYQAQRDGEPAGEPCDTFEDAMRWIGAARIELPAVAAAAPMPADGSRVSRLDVDQ